MKRYSLSNQVDGHGPKFMREDGRGAFVRHTDAQAAIEQARKDERERCINIIGELYNAEAITAQTGDTPKLRGIALRRSEALRAAIELLKEANGEQAESE